MKKLFSKYGILFILGVALLLRTIFLNEVPLALSNDELSFVINAKSISLTGRDILGSWQPWSLQPIYNTFPMSELAFLVAIPMLSLFKFSLFTAKLPYALFSTLLVGMLYLIANKLFGKKEALIVAIVGAISPWGIFLGRTAYDSPIAICFYMMALAILLYSKSWKILLSFIPFFLAFYTYIGTKIIFLPISLISIFYSWYVLNNKKFTKYYLILTVACTSLFLFFFLSLNSGNTGQRLSEINSPSSQSTIDKVNYERKLSVNSRFIPITVNKYVVFAKNFYRKYVGAFSPEYQFISGDNNIHLTLWEHGYLYYLDFVFLLFGFYYLFQKHKKTALLLTGLFLVAPIPAALSSNQGGYAYRGALLYPLFIIIIGIGISYLISLPKRPLLKIILIGTILAGYSFLLINFLIIYFLRYPIYNSEGPNFSTRVLSRYIALAKNQNKFVYVHSLEPDALYRGYVLYTNSYNKNTAKEISKNFNDKTYALNNVIFKPMCPSREEMLSGSTVIIEFDSGCTEIGSYRNTKTSSEIEQLSDGGNIFIIHKDSVCSNYPLPRYPSNFKFFDFNIEKLSTENFCMKYISNKN